MTRHGETEWNKIQRCQGWLDSPLTDKGVLAGKALALEVSDVKFDSIYSSDLSRAYNTAKLIKPNENIIKTPLLRELNLGAWNGLLFSELKDRDPEDFNDYFHNTAKYKSSTGGENFHDIMKRIDEFFKKYIYNSSDENVLIVSHGVAMIAIFNYMTDVPVERFWTNEVKKNGEFNIVEYTNGKFEFLKVAGKNNRYEI